MSVCALKFQDKTLGSTYRLQFAIKKDNVAWTDIDSVTLTFEKPDRTTTFARTATESATPGTWYYDTVIADLDETGYWQVRATVVDDTITMKSPPVGFRVVA